jgi:tetrahydromethanopterin S-methyltransferase subunit H
MLVFDTEQKVCQVGGVKFGGQPGQYPTVVVPSIFQKGDKVFEGKRKEGFDEKRAEDLLKKTEKLSLETGVPCMADIVATKGDELKTYVDFVTSVTDMPFCIDAWVMKPNWKERNTVQIKDFLTECSTTVSPSGRRTWRRRSKRSRTLELNMSFW